MMPTRLMNIIEYALLGHSLLNGMCIVLCPSGSAITLVQTWDFFVSSPARKGGLNVHI